jgi:hypothetical protein
VWPKLICATATLAGLWAIHRFRLRQAVAQTRKVLEERLSEQKRATLELHDTLAQGFHGIVLLFHMASDLVGTKGGDCRSRDINVGDKSDSSSKPFLEKWLIGMGHSLLFRGDE